MKHIIKILVTFIVFFICIAVNAQKVVDSSVKKRPQWVGSIANGFIIASATGNTIDEAQQKCMHYVLVRMLESVAQNIEYSSETAIEQNTHGQDVTSDIIFKQTGKSSVANLPYLQDMGISKAKDYYWEQIREKDGRQYYSYSLLYPFTTSDQLQLKEEFDKRETEMNNIVTDAESRLPNINSVDTLEKEVAQLEYAYDYFFDATRKSKAEHIMLLYKNVLKQLSLNSKRLSDRKYQIWVERDGNPVFCSKLPACKSATASKINCVGQNGTFVLTFSDEDCVPDDDNKITIRLQLKYNAIKYDLFF